MDNPRTYLIRVSVSGVAHIEVPMTISADADDFLVSEAVAIEAKRMVLSLILAIRKLDAGDGGRKADSPPIQGSHAV